MAKLYPDNTLETKLRESDISVQCLWQTKGPPHTDIAWMEALAVGHIVVIVQTFKSGGWSHYLGSPTITVDAAVEEVINAIT